VLGNTTTPEDQTLTVALSVLGIVYGVVAVSAVIFIIVPRMMASSTAAAGRPKTPARRRRRVRAARPGTRWSPSYDVAHSRPGAYIPRERVTRLSAAPNRRFTVPDPVTHNIDRVNKDKFFFYFCIG